eukprot:5394380-Pyramimonas_sp.AAC.1
MAELVSNLLRTWCFSSNVDLGAVPWALWAVFPPSGVGVQWGRMPRNTLLASRVPWFSSVSMVLR